MEIVNLRNNEVIAERVKIADTFFSRLIGLLNRKSLGKGEALVLKPTKSIHSLFMRFTFDAIFLDKNGKIIAIISSFKPFKFSPIYFNSHIVIELPRNTIKLTQIRVGDILKITE